MTILRRWFGVLKKQEEIQEVVENRILEKEAFGAETKVSDARVRLKAVCEMLEKSSGKD